MQMQGAATLSMPKRIVKERQLADRRPAAFNAGVDARPLQGFSNTLMAASLCPAKIS
jgi:hypothetical protein